MVDAYNNPNGAISTDAAELKPLGAHTALLAEASDAGSFTEMRHDGGSGDTAFPGNLKPIATVGEYDKTRGMLVGVPDGMGAMLKDANTVRLVWQAGRTATSLRASRIP